MNGRTHCPLCGRDGARDFHRDQYRPYLRCVECELVFVPASHHLDAAAEQAEYERHDNAEADPGYRAFLARVATPLLARLQPGARGLDFGCGPGPALAAMLREAGMRVDLYDVFFARDTGPFSRRYQWITATEVVEHLHRPGPELARLWSMLLPGGWLAVMTKLVRDRQSFAGWHYIRDPTHVCFFSRQTWRWWAGQAGAGLHFEGADVILLYKPHAGREDQSIASSMVL